MYSDDLVINNALGVERYKSIAILPGVETYSTWWVQNPVIMQLQAIAGAPSVSGGSGTVKE
jgi:hypothetical protein